MIESILAWWLASTVLGAAAFPVSWRLLSRLPDRGFGVSRALGILMGGYLLWLGASLGWLRNNPTGAVAAVLLVAAAGVMAGRGQWDQIRQWLRANRRTILVMEGLFLLCYVAWAVVRSFNPEIVATEKPMELAFLNSILRSPAFPPQDPWLSGHAISYYYLGYVLLTLLTWLTGVTAGVAFNLGNALWFGLVAVGAYAIVYDLLTLQKGVPRRAAALLGPLFVLISGNLGGVFDVMHSLHWFWTRLADGTLASRFWSWINLEDLAVAPSAAPIFPPNRFWFWWQASRVVNDIDLAGRHVEVIDEFPFFSFLLADNHPHVLTLPFAILALLVALQVYASARAGGFTLRWIDISPRTFRSAIQLLAVGAFLLVLGRAVANALGGAASGPAAASLFRGLLIGAGVVVVIVVFGAVITGRERSSFSTSELLLVGWLSGCLAFLNTWDLPIYLALILAAAFWGSRQDGLAVAARRVLVTVVAVAALAVATVLPWLPTFASQAGGLLPNLVYPTRLPQFLIMFAVPLVPAALWLFLHAKDELRRPGAWRLVAGVTIGLPLAMLVLSWLLAALVAMTSPEQAFAAMRSLGASGWTELASAAFVRRIDAPSVALLLSLLLGLAWLVLRRAHRESPESASGGGQAAFVVLMAALGAVLVLFPEFLYLRDSFGTRMNTVFKFYYAAWLLWGVAGAYALAGPWGTFGRRGRLWGVIAAVPVALGLLYTTTALWEKANHFNLERRPQLDGTAHLDQDNPADAVAIRWIRAALEPGILAEASGGSYSPQGAGRISAHTGFPTVLGWDFHEYQWRGDYAPQGTRAADLATLYQTRDWEEARQILEQYDIRYVYVGPLERSTYDPINTRKFEVFMDLLYQSDDVSIYGRKTEVGL